MIGPNGAGKTTLFRMIAGEEEPDGGELRVGDTVEPRLRRPGRAATSTPTNTVWKEISGGHDTIELGTREVNSRQYVSWFNFRGSDQQKRVGDLSGGERNRVHLAKLLRSGGNLLLLDEPTNDLDVDTLRALEDALLDFAGCAVVISHDRWFLDRIATHILAFEGDSQATWFEGALGGVRSTGCARRAAPRRSSRTGSSTSRSCARSDPPRREPFTPSVQRLARRTSCARSCNEIAGLEPVSESRQSLSELVNSTWHCELAVPGAVREV